MGQEKRTEGLKDKNSPPSKKLKYSGGKDIIPQDDVIRTLFKKIAEEFVKRRNKSIESKATKEPKTKDKFGGIKREKVCKAIRRFTEEKWEEYGYDPLRLVHWENEIPSLKGIVQKSEPFRYASLADFIDPHFLQGLAYELRDGIKIHAKESDLFKFYQSDDIGVPTELPHLEAFKSRLYSKRFRNFLENVMGLEKDLLTDKVDMALQLYNQGDHLMCHDDVIGTRVVTFVLYLSNYTSVQEVENEKLIMEPWLMEEGGAFELYDTDTDGNVNVEPSVQLLPHFNHATIFLVEPTKSYHAVEEIKSSSNSRVSIQGWFHAPTLEQTVRFEDRDKATLQDVLRRADPSGYRELPDDDMNWNLTEKENEYLGKWINAAYLNGAHNERIQNYFVEQSHTVLQNFFREDMLIEIEDDNEDEAWEVKGPPHVRKYLSLNEGKTPYSDEPTKRLRDLKNVIASPAFAKLLKTFTNLRIADLASSEVRRFKPQHYTIATVGGITQEKAELDVTWVNVQESDSWATQDVGGFESYMSADPNDDAETQEVYRANDGPLINLDPQPNCLSIVLRDKNCLKFVKYMSLQAPSQRTDITVSYVVHPDDVDDDESDSDEESDEEEEEEMNEGGDARVESEKPTAVPVDADDKEQPLEEDMDQMSDISVQSSDLREKSSGDESVSSD